MPEHNKPTDQIDRFKALARALLSIHQTGNGLELVARHSTVGGADLCLRWSGSIESAADLLREYGLCVSRQGRRDRPEQCGDQGLPATKVPAVRKPVDPTTEHPG